MTDRETQRRLDRLAMHYLDAVDAGDLDAVAALWEQAESDADLAEALHALNAELAAEADRTAAATVAAAAEAHLTSGEVVHPAAGPVTVGDVATDLFRHAPDRLPPEAHALNATLRASAEPLPADLGLSKLTAWAEAKFGPAPAGYWAAFHAAALKVEMRRASAVEFQLAARSAPKPGGRG